MYQIRSLRLHPLRRYELWKAIQNVENLAIWGSLGSLKVIGNSTIRQSGYDFLLAFYSNNCPCLAPFFWDSQILVENRRFETTPCTCISRRCWSDPIGVRRDLWRHKTQVSGRCFRDATLSRFDRTMTCDRRTERQTDRHATTAYIALA